MLCYTRYVLLCCVLPCCVCWVANNGNSRRAGTGTGTGPGTGAGARKQGALPDSDSWAQSGEGDQSFETLRELGPRCGSHCLPVRTCIRYLYVPRYLLCTLVQVGTWVV
ncbi:hypothetical protein LZ30DRAFT_723554 [Colletotrichum cereale]|nr:hypothetical protein LZ30DRAFT_723554 [Colletotrichum cereale]